MKNEISVQILTCNSEGILPEVLEALSSFSEIVILDTGSTDKTLSIGAKFPNVCIYQTQFKGFGILRNEASLRCSHDWVFAIDTDETPSNELCREVLYSTLIPDTIYAIRRRNYFNGKEIKYASWGKDFVPRLYHKKNTQFSTDKIHERLITQNRTVKKLNGHLTHNPYR